jgi:hypothetical protein
VRCAIKNVTGSAKQVLDVVSGVKDDVLRALVSPWSFVEKEIAANARATMNSPAEPCPTELPEPNTLRTQDKACGRWVGWFGGVSLQKVGSRVLLFVTFCTLCSINDHNAYPT